MDQEVSKLKQWYCRCGDTKFSEDEPGEDYLVWGEEGCLQLHIHHYYLVPFPSGTEQVMMREMESESNDS